MRGTVELPNVHDITLVLQNGCLVIVHIEVVWGRENGHDRWEARTLRFAVHAITIQTSRQPTTV